MRLLIALILIAVCAADSQACGRLRARVASVLNRPAVSSTKSVTRTVSVGGCANGSCVRPATPALLPPATKK